MLRPSHQSIQKESAAFSFGSISNKTCCSKFWFSGLLGSHFIGCAIDTLPESNIIEPTVFVCVCVFAIRARVSCSVALKLAVVAGGIGGQVIAGLTSLVLRLTESYPSISAFSFADDGHFLIIVTIDFRFLPVDSLSSYVRI